MWQLWDSLLSTGVLAWNYNNNRAEILSITDFEEFWVSVVSFLEQESYLLTQRQLVTISVTPQSSHTYDKAPKGLYSLPKEGYGHVCNGMNKDFSLIFAVPYKYKITIYYWSKGTGLSLDRDISFHVLKVKTINHFKPPILGLYWQRPLVWPELGLMLKPRTYRWKEIKWRSRVFGFLCGAFLRKKTL